MPTFQNFEIWRKNYKKWKFFSGKGCKKIWKFFMTFAIKGAGGVSSSIRIVFIFLTVAYI